MSVEGPVRVAVVGAGYVGLAIAACLPTSETAT